MGRPHARILQLDGLRGCAIAMVFLHHAYHVKLLWMGVDLFFVLSGFLITGILMNQKEGRFPDYLGHFYARRVRRILPPYLLLLVWVAIVFHGTWMRYWYLYVGGMNFILPFGLPSLHLLDPLWSLAVEEQFYLVWPLAVFYLSRKHLITLACTLLVLAPILRYVCTGSFHSPFAIYMLLPFRMDAMAAGALVALVWPKLQEAMLQAPALRQRVVYAALFVFTASAIGVVTLSHLGYSTYVQSPFGNTWIYESTLGMMFSAFMVTLIGYGKRLLTLWPCLWLGKISYTFYLVHLAFLVLLPGRPLLAFAAAVTYASASWLGLERHVLAWRSSKNSSLPASFVTQDPAGVTVTR